MCEHLTVISTRATTHVLRLYCTLPFDIPLDDLSWEFTLFGDVDVSTDALGLPDIPAGLALQLSWVGDVSVTLLNHREYSSTFEYAVVVTATLDFESTGIEVHLMVGWHTTDVVSLLIIE